MAYNTLYTTSLFGRRLGLQSAPIGVGVLGPLGNTKPAEFMVGPDDIRRNSSTTESTATNIAASGISFLSGTATTAGSSSVYTIDPPIPGVRKTLWGSSIGAYLKLANQAVEGIVTTAGSTFTVIKSTAQGGMILEGLTTALWLAIGAQTGFTFSTTT